MLKRILLAGIAASAFVSISNMASAQSNLPTVRVCTGLKGLNYYYVGGEFAKQAKGQMNIQIVTSKGSLDNLAKLSSNECDVAIVQSDALSAVDKLGSVEVGQPLYKEYWHLICNTDSGISRITGLNAKTPILLGDPGSGAELTWMNFVKADPKRYGIVPHEPIAGMRAAGIVQQGDKASCMAVVTGLNAQGIKDINEGAKQSKNLRLISSDDSDMLRIKDPKGHYVYTDETIPGNTYAGGLQPSRFLGSSGIKTVAVTAIIVADSDFIDKHEDDYQKFLHYVANALPGIKAHVEPQD